MTTRIWTSAAPDDGSIHCLGNGRMCAYEHGPDIIQVFDPPRSSPVLGATTLDAGANVRFESHRELGIVATISKGSCVMR